MDVDSMRSLTDTSDDSSAVVTVNSNAVLKSAVEASVTDIPAMVCDKVQSNIMQYNELKCKTV